MLLQDYTAVFSRHKKIALQFSGGKDSLAVLYLLKPYWNVLTVYYCNSGDAFPETAALAQAIKEKVPSFVEVKGRQPETQKQYGWPSDVVSCGNTPFARILGHDDFPLIDRYICCKLSIMDPMDERMKEDQITLIIRGQKAADKRKAPLKGGVYDGVELLFPIEDWKDADIFQYLIEQNVEIPQYYLDGLTSAPDCMYCTAWLEHGAVGYIEKHHPTKFPVLKNRLAQIKVAIEPYFNRYEL